jgi:hypothetical protein
VRRARALCVARLAAASYLPQLGYQPLPFCPRLTPVQNFLTSHPHVFILSLLLVLLPHTHTHTHTHTPTRVCVCVCVVRARSSFLFPHETPFARPCPFFLVVCCVLLCVFSRKTTPHCPLCHPTCPLAACGVAKRRHFKERPSARAHARAGVLSFIYNIHRFGAASLSPPPRERESAQTRASIKQ